MKRKTQLRMDDSIGKLADLIPYGHLMAQTDPVGFLDQIREEIVSLRNASMALVEALDGGGHSDWTGERIDELKAVLARAPQSSEGS